MDEIDRLLQEKEDLRGRKPFDEYNLTSTTASMPTIEDVRAAEKAMKNAQEQLRDYTEKPPVGRDRDVEQRRLAAELKRATDNYIRAILALRLK